ncbi:hypothetical protein CRYUN_Cryun09bG0104500 [Craigia yunnanensis]
MPGLKMEAPLCRSRSHEPSSGLLLLDKPFKFIEESNVGRPMSFSTEFSFSMSPGNGDGLAFVLIPNGFHTSSKLLQVGLSKLDDKRLFNPFLTYYIDLLEMWGNEDVFVGIISTANEDSSQSCSNVYSWRFRVRDVSSWMHSLPVDPRGYLDKDSQEFRAERRKFCALTILASGHMVFPVECQAGPEDFRYEKVNVIVEKEDIAYSKRSDETSCTGEESKTEKVQSYEEMLLVKVHNLAASSPTQDMLLVKFLNKHPTSPSPLSTHHGFSCTEYRLACNSVIFIICTRKYNSTLRDWGGLHNSSLLLPPLRSSWSCGND